MLSGILERAAGPARYTEGQIAYGREPRAGLTALSQFVDGGEQQLLLMLGAKPRFQIPKQHEEEDEEEREARLQNQGKAWWTLDKAFKNFARVCWRRRNHIIGKHYIAKRTLVLQTEPKEVV